MAVMVYKVLRDQLVHLEEMVPMVKMAVKETEENQDQEMEAWSFLDGDIRTTCPTTNDTELLYKGKAAGSNHLEYGGGANYICLPDEPEFLSYTPGISDHQSYIYGTEYEIYQNNGPFLHSMITMPHVLYVIFRLEYRI